MGLGSRLPVGGLNPTESDAENQSLPEALSSWRFTALTAVARAAIDTAYLGMFIFGVASGAAMIPYSVIKEVTPTR